MNGVNDRFSCVVRQLRHERGWSQEHLAERANLNRSYVGEIERGQARRETLRHHQGPTAIDQRHAVGKFVIVRGNACFAVGRDMDGALQAHRARWASFHARSWVSVPTQSVQALWYAEMAKLGSAVRAASGMDSVVVVPSTTSTTRASRPESGAGCCWS